MRSHILKFSLSLVFCCCVPLFSQTQPSAKTDQAAIVSFAQAAAVHALNFRQGDAGSMTHSHVDFTAQAWKDFMKHREWIFDQKGPPTFSSRFGRSNDALGVCDVNSD